MRIVAGIGRIAGLAALAGACLLAASCASTGGPKSSAGTSNQCLAGIADRLAVARDRGIGGTGISGGDQAAQDRGIGGTGISDERSAHDRGIGGTGISTAWGDSVTGFVGQITGFGSICVNGDEIAYDADTPVTIDGAPASAADLKIGQVVAATAKPTGAGFEATSIAVEFAIIGPISMYDEEGGRVTVLHQDISLGDLAEKPSAGLSPGSWIAVSGLLRADGAIVASRIDSAEPGRALRCGPVQGVLYGAGAKEIAERETAKVYQLCARGPVEDNDHIIPLADISQTLRAPFGQEVKALSIETYAGGRLSPEDLSSGPPGTPEPGQAVLPTDRPLIVRGTRDAAGNFRYQSIWVVEDRPIGRPPAESRPEDDPSRTIDRLRDVRPDATPTDIRPTDIRPTDVRPVRPTR